MRRDVVQGIAGEGEFHLLKLRLLQERRISLWRGRQLLGRRKVPKHVVARRRQLRGSEESGHEAIAIIPQPLELLVCDCHFGIFHRAGMAIKR